MTRLENESVWTDEEKGHMLSNGLGTVATIYKCAEGFAIKVYYSDIKEQHISEAVIPTIGMLQEVLPEFSFEQIMAAVEGVSTGFKVEEIV